MHEISQDIQNKYPNGFRVIRAFDETVEYYTMVDYEKICNSNELFVMPYNASNAEYKRMKQLANRLPICLSMDYFYWEMREAFPELLRYVAANMVKNNIENHYEGNAFVYDELLAEAEQTFTTDSHSVIEDIGYILKQNCIFYCVSKAIWRFEITDGQIEIKDADIKVQHSPIQNVW